jgi:protein arginine N-methyltransferase 1
LPRELRLTRTVTQAGRIDGFVVYFRTSVGDDAALSSSPLDRGRAPHWGFPILRTEFTACALGDRVELTLTVKAWDQPDTWRWQHRVVPA